ncbi:DUF1178 family protein [Rhizobium alvei]|uniref:DUF1178 family protein n=1 Tax=Rhizobium alvei TaxID=1132659 RepID=A0ABT8YMB3_9HYPH|nr:DUF1178 family protein [Rhizobium alvei]MDO6964827.1 DUF1178 family protein [Rhizobium alvei]
MIHYSLQCDRDHKFEGWFASSADYDSQTERGLITCPACGSASVSKMLMAPNVTTGRQKEATQALVMDNAHKEMIGRLREIVNEIKANAEDVGERFPEEARKIHYGEAEARGLIGKATPEEAEALIEEGVEIAALPMLPDDIN